MNLNSVFSTAEIEIIIIVIMETSKIQEQPSMRENAPVLDADIHSTLDIQSTQEITHFTDEVSKDVVKVDEQDLDETPNPLIVQDIYEILKRPRIIHTFKWESTSAFSAILFRIALPDALFASNTVWSKIAQFAFLHAGLKFQVRVNGTPYHYGQLLVVWRPATLGRTMIYSPTQPSSYDTIQSVSQRPHMVVSPEAAQVIEMEVPYQSPLDKIPIGLYAGSPNNQARFFANLGVLEGWVLNPLQATGATTDPPVTVNIFASFTNPKLSGYTHLASNYIPSTLAIPPPLVANGSLRYTMAIAQARRRKKREPSQTMAVFTAARINTAELDQPTQDLALTETSATENALPFNISDLMSEWSYLTSYNITFAQDNGALIGAIPVHPSNCMTGTLSNRRVFFHTKMSYLADLFSLWRGPIEFRFDFVASKFHSARVKIAWYPPRTASLAAYDEVGDEWAQIVDIQGQISTTFKAPWIQPVSYIINDAGTVTHRANGTIVLSLLNAISYPTNDAPPIYVNVWVRGPEVKFAGFTAQGPLSTNFLLGFANNTTVPTPFFPVAQAGPLLPISPVDLDSIHFKPTVYFKVLRSQNFVIPGLFPEFINGIDPSNYLIRFTSLLDYLLAFCLGYVGSLKYSVLTPDTTVYVQPRTDTNFNITRSDRTPSAQEAYITTTRMSASAYYPDSVNALKDFSLPNYTTMLYRPLMLYPDNIRNFSFSLPGITLVNLGQIDTFVTVAAGEGFGFYGCTAAPSMLSG